MKVVKVRIRATGEEINAIYAPTGAGHLRYHIGNKPYSDRKFDKLFEIVKEEGQLTDQTIKPKI